MEGARREGGTQDTEEGVSHRGWPGEAGRRGPQSLGRLCRWEGELGQGVGGLFCSCPSESGPRNRNKQESS